MSTSIALPFELHLGRRGLCLRPIVPQKYFLGMALRTKHGIFFVFIRVFFPLLGGVEVQHIGSAAAVKCMHLELNPAVKASFEMFKVNNISGPRQDAMKLASSSAFSCFASDSL
jgi:hypothetical protein